MIYDHKSIQFKVCSQVVLDFLKSLCSNFFQSQYFTIFLVIGDGLYSTDFYTAKTTHCALFDKGEFFQKEN